MKARNGAVAICIIFGAINVISFIGEIYEHRDHALQDLVVSDVVLLRSGPLTFTVASFAGVRNERIAGYWLVCAGVLSGVLFSLRLVQTPMTLLLAALIWVAPLLIAGWLWLKSAASRAGTVAYARQSN